MHGSKRRYEQLEPQLQRDIAADYRRGVRGHGLRALANTYQLPIPTVQHVVARAKPRFTAKVVQDQESEELSEEWKTEAKQWLEQVKRIPLDKRIYEDETPVYANEAPKKGRSRRGKPIFRTRSRYAKKKYTLHMYAKRSGVVHWDLSDKNADTNEIERVAREAVEQVEGGKH